MNWALGKLGLHFLLAASLLVIWSLAVRSEVPAVHEPAVDAKAGHSQTKVPAAAHEHSDSGHAGHGHEAPTVHGAPPKGLLGPGTEFLYVSPQLFFWTLLMFLPCVLVLKKMAWEPLIQSLESREHKIAESLRLAEEAKNDAQRLMAEQDAAKTKAFSTIRETIEQMKGAAEKESEQILSAAKADAAKELVSAKAEIEAARAEALAEIKTSAAGLAASMAGKLAARSFDDSRFASVIGEIGS